MQKIKRLNNKAIKSSFKKTSRHLQIYIKKNTFSSKSRLKMSLRIYCMVKKIV